MEAAATPVPGLVLTIGTFDLLHYGHVAFFRRCSELGAYLVVGVNTDEFAASFKRPPVMSGSERQHAIEQIGYRTRLNFEAGRDLISQVRPSVLAVGSDWARKDYHAQIGVTQDDLDTWGIIVAYVPYTAGISTSEIRRRIAAAG